MIDFSRLEKLSLEKFNRIVIAYSGGLDSTVLLHALSSIAKYKKDIIALHINHGVSPNSNFWLKHCAEFCSSLKVGFVSLEISADKGKKISEDLLREKRYKSFSSFLKKGDILCTAHHLDDHVETILFRIMRGTGIKGLSGIEQSSSFRDIDLIRPFLSYSKADLLDYAKKQNINWIEDESNEDLSYSRNFIRKKIIPNLRNKKNWPSYLHSLSYLSDRAKEANEVLEEIADMDLKRSLIEPLVLSVQHLKELSKGRARNVLFKWLNSNSEVRVPNKLINEVYKNIIFAKKSSKPSLSFGKKRDKGSFTIKRFNDCLYYIPSAETECLSNSESWDWDLKFPLVLPTGVLSTKEISSKGMSLELVKNRIYIKGRNGGERCQPLGRPKSQKLKKLLQEHNIPPWIRNRIPLIYVGDEIAAVSDLWVCEAFKAKKGERGIILKWEDNLRN